MRKAWKGVQGKGFKEGFGIGDVSSRVVVVEVGLGG
jgi:hypothetical protein